MFSLLILFIQPFEVIEHGKRFFYEVKKKHQRVFLPSDLIIRTHKRHQKNEKLLTTKNQCNY